MLEKNIFEALKRCTFGVCDGTCLYYEGTEHYGGCRQKLLLDAYKEMKADKRMLEDLLCELEEALRSNYNESKKARGDIVDEAWICKCVEIHNEVWD